MLVTVIRAAPEIVFDLESDTDVHTAPMATTGEQATTSTERPLLGPGTRSPSPHGTSGSPGGSPAG